MNSTTTYLLVLLVALSVGTPPARAEVPANGWITFASKRQDGRREIYLMKADGAGVTRLTFDGGEDPKWSPNGAWIAYQKNDIGPTMVIRWDGSDKKQVHQGQPMFWMQDGSGLVTNVGFDYYLVDPDTGKTKLLFKRDDFDQLRKRKASLVATGISRDGRWLIGQSTVYAGGNAGSNGMFDNTSSVVVLDFKDRSKVYYVGNGCEGTFNPAGTTMYHVRGLDAERDLYQLRTDDLKDRASYKPEVAVPAAEFGYEYFPSVSNDGKWMAYGATTGCHDHDNCDYEIFIHKIGTGPLGRTRVTTNTANDRWPSLWVGPLWKRPSQPLMKLGLQQLSLDPGTQPGIQEVYNIGPGDLQPVTASVAYADARGGWLKSVLAGSGNKQRIEHRVVVDGLPAGSYQATVTLSAANASNSVSYQVRLLTHKTETISNVVPPDADLGGCAVGGVAQPQTGPLYPVMGLLVLVLLRRRRRPLS